MTNLSAIVALSTLMLIAACGDDKKDKTSKAGAQAKVKLFNATDAALHLADEPSYDSPAKYTPTTFKIKLLTINLKQELDTNNSPASMLYLDPACKRQDLEDSAERYSPDVDPKDRIYYKYVGLSDICHGDDATDYVELSLPAAEVNAKLNAQNLPVLPGKYKYVSIDFCDQRNDTKPNVAFQTEGMDAEQTLTKPGTCGWVSTEINPPLEITKDSTVDIKLNYELDDMFLDYGSDTDYTPYMNSSNIDCYVNADKSVRRCINKSAFKVTASVEAQ